MNPLILFAGAGFLSFLAFIAAQQDETSMIAPTYSAAAIVLLYMASAIIFK